MIDLRAEKKRVRRLVRESIAGLGPEARFREEERLCGVLKDFLLARPTALAGQVLAYLPLPDEPGLMPVLEFLQRKGCLCLPQMTPEGDLLLRKVACLASDLVTGPYGVREPAESCPLAEEAEVTAVIVPGRAFTPAGDRLGRGKGYYDRLLARLPERAVCAVAAAFACQIFAALPVEEHDRRVGHVLFFPAS